MKIRLSAEANTDQVNKLGFLDGVDFAFFKFCFRTYVDTTFDHHLLLWEEDEYAALGLKGTTLCPANPTVENIVQWIANWAGVELDHYLCQHTKRELHWTYKVTVQETYTNWAEASWEGGQDYPKPVGVNLLDLINKKTQSLYGPDGTILPISYAHEIVQPQGV
jgi:6-pyruvoyl-tetrahydropterin synthase